MSSLAVKAIVLIVAVIVIAVAGYTAVTYYHPATKAASMDSFIPQNSYAVVHYQNDTQNVYAYQANDSVGAVQAVSMSTFFSNLNTSAQTASNNQYSGVNITSIGMYKGYQLFEAKLASMNLINLTIESFLQGMIPGVPTNLSNTLITNATANLSSYQDQYLNSNVLYVSPVSTSITLLGQPGAVYDAISGSVDGVSFNTSVYLNVSTNVSLYVNVQSLGIINSSSVPSFFTSLGFRLPVGLSANVTVNGTSVSAHAYLTFANNSDARNMNGFLEGASLWPGVIPLLKNLTQNSNNTSNQYLYYILSNVTVTMATTTVLLITYNGSLTNIQNVMNPAALVPES